MREVNAAAQAQREKRGALLEVSMIWIDGRHRETGAVEGLGLWSGEGDEAIAVTDMFTGAGSTRMFYAGGLLSVGSVRHEAGLTIRPTTVRLSSIDGAARAAIRQYDPRGAEVQVWKRAYDPSTRLPLGVEPWFKGYVNGAVIDRPTPGGEGAVEIEIVSTARMLTISSPAKKSDERQRRRALPGQVEDRFLRYKGNVKNWDVPWGQ